MESMKVKHKAKKGVRHVTLRMSEAVMKKVDELAEKEEMSRQKLIAAILKQTMNDRSFVLDLTKLKDDE